MKLHLPKALRGALLACFASVAGLTTTLATGALTGGAFYLAISQSAMAEDVNVTSTTTWTNADAATHADDNVTVGTDAENEKVTLQVGNGNTNALGANASIDFGTVTVNEGDTLKLHVWTTSDKAPGASGKVSIASDITLNNAEIYMEDGSYNYSGAITVSGQSTIRSKWAKGINLGVLVGDEDSELTLVHGVANDANVYDGTRAVFNLSAESTDFYGVLNLVDDNGAADYNANGTELVISNTNALVNAVLNFGETEDVLLSLNVEQVVFRAITGKGTVQYYNGANTQSAIQVTNASGTFSGTSASNVAWTISGGKQGLENASILGTYTVAEGAESSFSGDIVLGSLVNNSTNGIDISGLSSLTINSQEAYLGAVISGLGLLTGADTFTYGNGWLATYDSVTGTAIVTADGAIAWADTGAEGDTDINWSTAGNWSGVVAPTATDYVQLAATEGVTRTIALTADTTVGSLRVYDAYNLSVAQGSSYSFTATNGYTFTGDTASLSKTGEGTLSMSLAQAQAAKMHITEGALKLTDTFSHTLTQGVSGRTHYDLTGITSAATGSLQVDLNGTWSATGMDATAVKLDANFHGTLSVIEGQLLVKYGDAATDGKSDFGGASAIELNTAALYFNANSEVNVTQLIIGNGGAYFTNRSASSVINSALSGTGNLTIHGDKGDDKGITLTGVINLDGKLTVKSTTLTINSATKALFDGGISQTGGNININSAADISELSVTGGTFKINGANVGISSLKSGALTLTGEANLTATLAADAQVTLTGANTADATLTVADGGSATLLNSLTLKGLTLNSGGVLKLSGAVDLGSLSNAGVLDVSDVTSLSISDLVYQADSRYHVGSFTNVDDMLALIGNGGYNYLTASYDAASGYITFVDSTAIAWDDPATDDGEHVWGTADNWSHDAVLTETDVVALNGGDGVCKTIEVADDSTVAGIHVNDAYTFSVAADKEVRINVGEMVFGQNGSIAKTGAGKLYLTVELAHDSLEVSEGTLAVNSLTPASGTFTLNGNGRLETAALTLNEVVVSEQSAELQAGSLTLVSGNTFTKKGTGTFELSNASGLLGKDITVESGTMHITQTGVNARVSNGTSFTIQVNTGATLDDDRRLALTGGTVDITGGGVYELEGICLSFAGGSATTVNVADNTTLHITGTTTNATGGDGDGSYSEFGSFMMSNWGTTNVLNIEGKVISDTGISNRDGKGTINIKNGGVLQMNGGLNSTAHGAADQKYVTINVKGGGVLDVRGENVTNAARIKVSMERESILMGGAASGENAKVANTLSFTDGAFIGAKAGSTLTLAPASGSMSLKWMDVIGTEDTNGVAQGAGGKVVFTTAVTSAWNVNVQAGSEADFQGLLTINGQNTGEGLHNAGTLTLNGAAVAGVFENTATATLKGAVSFGSLTNSGSIDVAGVTSLTLRNFSMTDGAIYNVGTLTGLSETHTIGALLGAGAGHTVTYDGTSTISVVSHLVWDGQTATEGDNVWNSTNTNWTFDAADSAFLADKVVVFAENSDAVNSTVVLGEDATASTLRVLGAYNFSVESGETRSLAATNGIEMGANGSFAKTGEGTLVMSNADALTAGVNIQAGALLLSGVQANTVNGNTTLEGATITDTWRESGLMVDLSGISAGAEGTLQVTLAGQSASGNDSTRLQLSENFTGKLEVLGGQLGYVSALGGATQVILNGAGLVFNNDADNSNDTADHTTNNLFATPVHISGTGMLRAWGAYESTAAALAELTGGADATLQKHDDGTICINELSGFAGAIEIHGGKLMLADATGTANVTSLAMVAGTGLVLENGQQLTVGTLLNGSYIDLNGASSLTLQQLNSAGTLDMEGDAAASASFAVAAGDTFTLSHNGLTLGALTNAGEGTLVLNGELSLGTLSNLNGILDVTNVSSLSIADVDYSVGASYHVGQVIGGDILSLIGNGGNNTLSATYDETTGYITFDANNYWLDNGTDGDNVWSSAENWSSGAQEGFSLLNTMVKLGDEAANKNILLQSDVDASTTVHVAASGYSFSVAEGDSYAFNGTLQYANEQVTGLTKDGAGSLTVSLAQASANGGMHIANGRLVVLGNVTTADGKTVVGGFTANGPHDLSAISSSATGILSVALYGNTANNTFDTSALTLADDFTGTLEVTHGYLLMHYNDTVKSTLGGTSKIRLDGGGVALYDQDSLNAAIEVGANGGWLMGRQGDNVYSGAITGAGQLTLVSNWGGADELTIAGSINLGDYVSGQDENGADIISHSNVVKKGDSIVYVTGADNNINITGGVIVEAGQLAFQNNQTLNSLTLNGGELIVGSDTEAATMNITAGAIHAGTNGRTRKVTLKSGSEVNDSSRWQLTGGSLTMSGEGTYNAASLTLSANGAQSTTLTVEEGVTLHVTGTATNASKTESSFNLGHWNANNTVNVHGVLALESGISTYSGYASAATINVNGGGTLAFNNGLTAAGKDNAVTINVVGHDSDRNQAGTLQVSGTATTGTNLVTVVVGRNATILGGHANGATESLIANDMVIEQGFYVGAAAGTTLTLKPESGNFTFTGNSPWINVLGTADNQGGKVVLDVTHLDMNALTVQGGAEAVITGDATLGKNVYGGTTVEADATLTFDGAGVLTLGSAIQNGGTVQFINAEDMQFVLSDALLTEDLTGVSRTWTLVEGGTLVGWDKDTLSLSQFTLNGEVLNLGDWDGYSLEDGKLTLTMLSRFWDATAEGAEWNTTDANWRPAAASEETAIFEANSRVTFTDTDESGTALNKSVAVADAGVHARSVLITGTGYEFNGGNVLVNESLYARQDAVFNNTVVMGSSDTALEIKVDDGVNLSISTLETRSEVKNGVSQFVKDGGSFRKTGTGTLTITDAVSGIINEVAVESGTLTLDSDVALTVGTNVITGGTLSNVLLQNYGLVKDHTSDAKVTAGNVITSCDGTNDAVLTNVNLQVGSATAYGSLQNVTFAGNNSTLSGYITFEKTKHQREMAVADGGSLNVSGLTLDLHGLSGGEKVLIENVATTDGLTGTITGWENITLKYSGVNVNMGSVDVTTAGIVNIKTDGADLYWDGLGADGAADANWNATSTNWNTQAGVDGSGVYLALSDTYFAATPQGAAKDINVAQDMVATNIYITQGGYSFSGYRVATLGNVEMNTTDAGAISFNNELVVQGTLIANVAGALNLGGETTVVKNADLTVGALTVTDHLAVYGDLNVTSGSATPGGEGSFTLTEGADISANNITITVNAGASSDSGFADAKMQSAGNISTTGTLALEGNAAKTMTGAVEAKDIVVNTGVSTNEVSFAQVTAETLTVAAGSTANLTADGTAGISQINLSGTLGFEKFAGNFWNYDVVSTSENASVNIASIGKVSMKSLSGADLGNGTYGSIVFNGGFRRLTIDNLHHVQNITFGASEEGVFLTNGTGQIYGDLTLDAGASLTVNCDNIMANGNGAWYITGTMKLGNTTQTLAGNAINLSAAVISGNMYHQETQQAENGDAVTVDVLNNGILLTEDTRLMFTGDNTISANMKVAEGKTLTLRAGMLPEDNLTISGHLGGSGAVLLDGSRGTGTLTLAADNDYSGTMTVKGGMTINLAHVGALSEATLHLDAGAVLLTDAGALGAPAQIGSLNLVGTEVVTREGSEYNAGLIQVNNLMATEGFSAGDAAFMVGELNVSDALTLNLQLAFTEGGLQNMMTYNIFTADAGYSLADLAEQLNLELYVVDNGISSHVASNQYKVMYDAEQNVISLRTMLGHIWSGGELDTNGNGLASDGIWSVDNTDGNWSGKNYDESSGYSNAIFVDLPLADGDSWNIPTVTIEGTVAPGDIYFEANTTYYELTAAAGNGLAAGTNIHKAGEADVFLNLADNGTLDKAVGTLDIQAGMLTLYSDLAVSGDITIGGEAHVRAFDGVLVREHYTAKGDFINLTMNDDVISGASAENKGTIKSHYNTDWTVNIVAAAGESVMLQNVTLATTTGQTGDALTNVTIGENVDVTGNYTLNGHITFEHTLANTGTVTLDAATTVEIGKLGYAYQVVSDAETSAQYHVSEGGSYYVYQLVQGGTINGMDTLGVEDVYINGVNISTGLADGVATIFSSNDGSLTLSIGNATYAEDGSLVSVDGTVGMPTWDERWGAVEGQPGISRRYAGTDADAKLTFAEGKDGATQYYWYSSVVNADNANKVNGETEEVVVTLSSAATGSVAAGGGTTSGDAAMEMWMYDRSGFNTVIAGRYHEGSAPTNAFTQAGDTHLLVNTHSQWQDAQKEWVVGGSWNVAQNADSYVTVQAGNILTLVGGTYGANQAGDTHVFVDGGSISEIFAGGYEGGVNNSNLTITGGTLGLRNDSVRKRVYGGSYYGTVSGNVNVVVDGNATITELVGGGYHGAVTGDITLDLISGTATRVDAAGVDSSTVGGNVLVNLHNGFGLTEIYGGKQAGSGATVTGSSTLSFINAGETYDMTGTTVQGFSHFELADDVYVKLTTDNNAFGTDGQSGQLTISGAGKVELGGSADLMRDITLADGATLWVNSNYVGNSIYSTGDRSLITVQDGTTLDITGRPNPNEAEGLCLWLDMAGHGANGMGALYKGALAEGGADPSGKVALPRVTLSDSASVNAEASIFWIECRNEESSVQLNGNTLTKVGDKDLVIYNADVTDSSANDADAAVDGTFFVKEGTLGIGYGMRAGKTNVVLSEGATLDIIAQGSNDAIVGALSGSGSVVLDNTFTITTSTAGSYGKGSDWMTQGADKYSQFSADSGFAYGVFSGNISGAQGLALAGDGTQYFSGNSSTFSGGVKIQDAATLYLMGSTEGSASMGSSSATAGAVGTGTIAWDSANAKLYLGNGVQVYNNGTTNVAGSNMIIGVEAAPKGDALTNYLGANSKGTDGGVVYITLDGVDYVEVDTHNLQSISCDGKYADGSFYMAGSLIDRDKMLLVEKSVWEAGSATVAGFSEGGYNTATYSGVLSGNANLMKVGLGTLILDQTNTYTGSTIIDAGSLVLKGWAKIGGSATSAALNVEQKAGSTLMLAYDGSYGNEITGIANDMYISGTGDERWKTESATGNDTAALISAISSKEKFTLSGNISGDGNLLHTASGTLVLSGDSTYTGGTHATMGVLEVQSATGLGSGKVVMDKASDLHVTVEDGTTASQLTTTIKAADSAIDGDVIINGTDATERVLNMSTDGYNATSTQLNDTGVLLVNGSGVQAKSGMLSGTGKLVVSDATGAGASAQMGGLMDYSGDFVVEGSKASISVAQGNFNGGSISVSGQGAKVSMESGSVHVANGEKLALSSEGSASTSSAAMLKASSVTIDSGATLTVDSKATQYQYNLEKLAADASLAPNPGSLVTFGAGQNIHLGAAEDAYTYHFDADRAMNAQSAGVVDATQGLTLKGGSRYEAERANISLAGGSLTLDTTGGKITLNLLTEGNVMTFDDGMTSQMVLFTDVTSVNLGDTVWGMNEAALALAAEDGLAAQSANTIYSTLASQYFTGWNITDQTYLVYDVGAGVVYLDKAVPEPTTTTLSLLALAALVARRRRK